MDPGAKIMGQQSHVGYVVESVLDYCRASQGQELPRLIGSIRRLAAHLSPVELREIEQRVRLQLGLCPAVDRA